MILAAPTPRHGSAMKRWTMRPDSRIEIDDEACVSAGNCVMAASELFDQREEDGVAILRRQPESDDELSAAREAVDICPAQALRLVGFET